MSEEPRASNKYVMVESNISSDEDEIDIFELICTILEGWKTITGITVFFTGLAVAYALNAPEIFRAETLLAPAKEEKSDTTSALSQFGGLASLAGISIPSDSNVEQVVATLNSRKFLRTYIQQNNLLKDLFEEIWDSENQTWLVASKDEEPTEQLAVAILKGCLSVDQDKQSGLITLSILWKDPEIAATWANDLVKQLNKQLREKAISDSQKRVGYLEQELAKTTLQDMRAVLYKLLESEKQKAMLANVNEDFALEVIDPAVASIYREKPKRKIIVVLGGVCGFFLGIFSVFISQFLKRLRSSKRILK